MMEFVCVDLDFGAILICAVRYALGRRTYMPGLVTDWIMDNCRGKLALSNIRTMILDIEEQGKSGPEAYGDSCDLDTWMRFLAWLKEEEKRDERV